MHDTTVIVRRLKHRNMGRKLFEIEPGLFFNVVPIHFDEIVTFTKAGWRKAVKKKKTSEEEEKRKKICLLQTKKGAKLSRFSRRRHHYETWGD